MSRRAATTLRRRLTDSGRSIEIRDRVVDSAPFLPMASFVPWHHGDNKRLLEAGAAVRNSSQVPQEQKIPVWRALLRCRREGRRDIPRFGARGSGRRRRRRGGARVRPQPPRREQGRLGAPRRGRGARSAGSAAYGLGGRAGKAVTSRIRESIER